MGHQGDQWSGKPWKPQKRQEINAVVGETLEKARNFSNMSWEIESWTEPLTFCTCIKVNPKGNIEWCQLASAAPYHQRVKDFELMALINLT